jgi:transposase
MPLYRDYSDTSSESSSYSISSSLSIASNHEYPSPSLPSSPLLPSVPPPILPPRYQPTLHPSAASASLPPPSTTSTQESQHMDLGVRIQALALLEAGIKMDRIIEITKISRSQIYRYRKKAKEAGYVGENDLRLKIEYIDDRKRKWKASSKGLKMTPEVIEAVTTCVTRNSTTRQYSCSQIAYQVNTKLPAEKQISPSTVYRILKKEGYSQYKQTVKPGLNKAAKKKRLEWYLKHKDWTLDDWKNVIFTDETSVQLASPRGKIRVWRTANEAFNNHVIKRRYKGKQGFIFWDTFSYDHKCDYHI